VDGFRVGFAAGDVESKVKRGVHVTKAERRVARQARDEGKAALWVLGELHTIRVRGEAYALLDSATPPGGGLPPHIHRDQDEAIYILNGEYTLVIENEESRMVPGSFASVPRGTVHALKKLAGDAPGLSLAILTPRGAMERFLEEVGVPVVDRSVSLAPPKDAPEMEDVIASAKRHGIYLLTRPV
jgi:quercetin dioxygenase-like cupin family protein